MKQNGHLIKKTRKKKYLGGAYTRLTYKNSSGRMATGGSILQSGKTALESARPAIESAQAAVVRKANYIVGEVKTAPKRAAEAVNRTAKKATVAAHNAVEEVKSIPEKVTGYFRHAKMVAKNTADKIDKMVPQSIIHDLAGVNTANKDWSIVAPKLYNNLNETAELLSYSARDPALKKILQRSILVYGTALKDLFHIAEPTITDLTDTFWKTVDDMGTKSAQGATTAMVGTFSAAIAAVPGIGAAVGSVIALSQWYNAVSKGVLEPSLTFSGEIAGKTIKMGRDGFSYYKHKSEKLAKTYEEVSYMLKKAQMLKKARQLTQSVQPNRYAPAMRGGGDGSANLKVVHNINTSVKRFTQKHPVKARVG